ncbi:type II toxin-antitoxin system YafQ family toxin [Photobacterium halotolerans]|uniref:type II toxin-antitoxin system YafQ family toxin n=1 Tax=Photobacterium halotolerans TaxID=265726 RepID=UPI00048367B7|nr:type II toxin-antitoxin system YafQ family toxin [Photobacterium halotolerans]
MLKLVISSVFKREYKKTVKQSVEDSLLIGQVVGHLRQGVQLPPSYLDHALTGNFKGFRECHIKPDLLLIYKVNGNELQLARLGSHSELFS